MSGSGSGSGLARWVLLWVASLGVGGGEVALAGKTGGVGKGGGGASLGGGVSTGTGSSSSSPSAPSSSPGSAGSGAGTGTTSGSTAAKEAVYGAFVELCSRELTGTRPTANERVVCRALTQLGLCESDRGAGIFPRGQVDYTFGNPEAWCSEFVSFNYLAAGMSMKGGDIAELPWLLRNVDTLRGYFSSRSAYVLNDGTQVPQAGDWLELREGHHSGIAMGVVDQYLVSIEGNVGGCVALKVRKDFSDASRSDLVGWGSASTLVKRFASGTVKASTGPSVGPKSR